jgi:hypothetical protein
VDKPGRQFSACMAFRVRVVFPGDKEGKKWKSWEAWLLSDLLVLGEREKTKTHDRLTVKAWLPLELVSLEADDCAAAPGTALVSPSSEAAGGGAGGATTRRTRKETKVALSLCLK